MADLAGKKIPVITLCHRVITGISWTWSYRYFIQYVPKWNILISPPAASQCQRTLCAVCSIGMVGCSRPSDRCIPSRAERCAPRTRQRAGPRSLQDYYRFRKRRLVSSLSRSLRDCGRSAGRQPSHVAFCATAHEPGHQLVGASISVEVAHGGKAEAKPTALSLLPLASSQVKNRVHPWVLSLNLTD